MRGLNGCKGVWGLLISGAAVIEPHLLVVMVLRFPIIQDSFPVHSSCCLISISIAVSSLTQSSGSVSTLPSAFTNDCDLVCWAPPLGYFWSQAWMELDKRVWQQLCLPDFWWTSAATPGSLAQLMRDSGHCHLPQPA